ncbi:MAG: phosphatase PAP2 family protein [Fimbriimonadales bacterium]|nr:phosphatase PAP2 family protein [Fimbriimonadales bacterium]
MDALLHYDRELFFALNHGLNHPLLDPLMWLITSLGLGWVQMLLVLTAWGVWEWRRRGTLTPAPSSTQWERKVSSPLSHAMGEGGWGGEGDDETPLLPRCEKGAGGDGFRSGFKTLFLPALLAFVGSGLTAQLIKRMVPRLRPSNLPDAIVAPDERIFHNSFPSGHTTTAFALAFWVFLLTRSTRYRFWGYGALLLAGLVGLSRIYRGVHYPSDVIAGAAIGVLWGAIAYFTLNARRVPDPPAAVSTPDSASVSPRD